MKTPSFSRIASLVVLAALSFASEAQTPLPYVTGFDGTSQQAGWVQYRLGAMQPAYQWTYSNNAPFTAPTCLSHNYPVGGMTATDDWFVSPRFNLSNGGLVDSVRHVYDGFGLPQPEDTIALYLLTGHPNPDSATTRTLFHVFTDTTYQNDNVWRVSTNLLIPAGDTNSYVAFRYKTVVNWLDVRFDNVSISGNTVPSIGPDRNQASIRLAVQPVTDFLQFTAEKPLNCTLEVFGITGQRLMQTPITLGERIPLALTRGTYVYRLTSDTRVLRSERFVVQ